MNVGVSMSADVVWAKHTFVGDDAFGSRKYDTSWSSSIVLFGTLDGFSRMRKRGMSARGNICSATELSLSERAIWQVSVATHLGESVELRANGLEPVRDSNRVVEHRVGGVNAVRFLNARSQCR